MKLLTKTNGYYLIFIIALFPLMMLADYFIIKHYVYSEVNEMLLHERDRLQHYYRAHGVFPPSNYLLDTTEIGADVPIREGFSDTLLYDAYAAKEVPYRTYEFSMPREEHQLVVRLRHVLLEMQELIGWLFGSTAMIILLLAMGLFLINRQVSKWVWKPFYENLSQLKKYDPLRSDPIKLSKSNITEFNTLSEIMESLTHQISKDFQNLKDFNEHISHEMQTPLAIIRNKMVLLLENQNLDEKELRWAQTAYHETNKLSKIVKSLSLISRIENHEFKRLEKVDVHELLENIITNMEELIEFKGLKITSDLQPARINCDPLLANILFTNLIKNAVQHNKEQGYIKMSLSPERFEIENTGELLKTKTEQLFDRFEKGNMLSDSVGLGLSINQRICEMYGFELEYDHHQGNHKLALTF